MNASSDDASMNPSSIRFVLEALLHGAHMQMSLEVLHKDLKSDERLLFYRQCQRLQWHLEEVILFFRKLSCVRQG